MANENVVEAAVQHKMESHKAGIMAPDQILACDTGKQYVVEKMLGAGRYGEVYKVSLVKEPQKKFALKLAENQAKSHRLKTEALIFEEIEKASSDVDKTRFVKMYHHGRTPTFKYYLMDLIWLCLDQLVDSAMSPSTLLQIARQSLQGIEALHNLGYMHRDVGPWCFAVGMPPRENNVYLLDFGAARSHKNARIPRSRENFVPQWRYASIAAMEGQDPTRKDDIVGWLYMILELYDRKNLPWREIKDLKGILKGKQEQQKNWLALTKSRELKVPVNFYWINSWIMKEIKPQSAVDFASLYRELTATAALDNINEQLPFEWIGRRPKSPERPAAATSTKEKKEATKEKKKKRKCSHATQQDVQVAMDDLLEMIEKQKKLWKKQSREKDTQMDEEDDEDDETDSSQKDKERKRRGKKKKSKGGGSGSRNSDGKKRRKRKSGKKRKKDKEGRDEQQQPSRSRNTKETATGQDTLCDEKDSSMTVEPFTARKKASRRNEGNEKPDEPKRMVPESSDVRSEGGKTIEVEVRTRESVEHKIEKKTRADEEFELVSVKGLEPDKDREWAEDGRKDEKRPASKRAAPDPDKKRADDAAPVKKEPAASTKK